MKPIEVYLTARSAPEDDLKGRAVLVIDVLRASTTIVTALDHGARAVIPVSDMAEASRIAGHMEADLSVLGGERGGTRIDGYQLGNSPLEYTPEAVQRRTVVLNTTNGTRAITRARLGAEVAIASFRNVSAAIRFLYEAPQDAVIVCAGTDDRVSLEDTLCAGLVLHQLWGGRVPEDCSDAAHVAHSLFAQEKHRLGEALRSGRHARRLTELGFAEDVSYCAQLDAAPVLPIYRDSRITLRDPAAARFSATARPPDEALDAA